MAHGDWAAKEMTGKASLPATVYASLSFCKEADWGLGMETGPGGSDCWEITGQS